MSKGVLYLDKKGREVLYVPHVFIVINYARKEPDVILEPERLEYCFRNWKNGKAGLKKLIDYPEIDEKDIKIIIKSCFSNEINEAKGRCIDIFDQKINRAYDID